MRLFTARLMTMDIETVINLPGWSHCGPVEKIRVSWYPFEEYTRKIYFHAESRTKAAKACERLCLPIRDLNDGQKPIGNYQFQPQQTTKTKEKQMKKINVPRNQWRKLWNWCLAHSEIGGVNVRVYWSGNYTVKADKVAKRLGRAHPEITTRTRWDVLQNREVLTFSNIRWSYVY